MKKIFACPISAQNYQFWVHDDDWDMEEELPEPTVEDERKAVAQGYMSTKSWAKFNTRATNHAHWLEVYTSDTPPLPEDCDRLIAVPISIPSGTLAIHGPTQMPWGEEYPRLEITPGQYCLCLLAYNSGVDIQSLGDETAVRLLEHRDELEQYPELERYRIVLVLGNCPKKGVLYSAARPKA